MGVLTDEDRKLVEELRRIGSKPCLAMATFFEEAEKDPSTVMAKAADLGRDLPEPIADLDGLLAMARSIASDLVADAREKEARREALKEIVTIDALVEASERMLYEGDFGGARQGFEDAVAKIEASFGPDAKELVIPLMGLARASGQETTSPGVRNDAELALQKRALDIAEKTLAMDDMVLAECLHAHGVSTWSSGDADGGAALLARALEVAERAKVDATPFLAPLVGALLDAGRPKEAVPHARELLRLEAEGTQALDLTTMFVVGQALRDAGVLDEARVVLERFLTAYGEEGDPRIKDEVKSWLAAMPKPS